ncbi:MAG: hypothetical protein JJE04_16610 [Acidobacteriia bacterium]|nr:hypothetical protein [Terriglobia bacterium]
MAFERNCTRRGDGGRVGENDLLGHGEFGEGVAVGVLEIHFIGRKEGLLEFLHDAELVIEADLLFGRDPAFRSLVCEAAARVGEDAIGDKVVEAPAECAVDFEACAHVCFALFGPEDAIASNDPIAGLIVDLGDVVVVSEGAAAPVPDNGPLLPAAGGTHGHFVNFCSSFGAQLVLVGGIDRAGRAHVAIGAEGAIGLDGFAGVLEPGFAFEEDAGGAV